MILFLPCFFDKFPMYSNLRFFPTLDFSRSCFQIDFPAFSALSFFGREFFLLDGCFAGGF
ncbi:MAG: hypothetical protein EGP82_15190 [Odoribacter splanchnicus]|nr:hypothetical protein [Odoribacter splanchnicus]